MIDILLSTYNGKRFLEAQLNSLFSQSYQDFKLLIRDDCSSDNTVEILNCYKQKYPTKIQIVNNDNKNLKSTASFLTLLKYSTSELIMFCDQDDVWNIDKLETMNKYYNEIVKEKTKPILIHSAVDVVDELLIPMEKETLSFNRLKFGMEKSLCWQVFQNDVTGCTTMINSKMRDLICSKEIQFGNIIQHDWFLANIAYLYGSKYYYPEKTIKYRQHSNNVISAKKTSIIRRISQKINYGTSFPFYKQISELLKVLDNNCNNENRTILKEFADLESKPKLSRIYWLLKHRFLREGNVFFKIYHLYSC